jgi:hypothetical protein
MVRNLDDDADNQTKGTIKAKASKSTAAMHAAMLVPMVAALHKDERREGGKRDGSFFILSQKFISREKSSHQEMSTARHKHITANFIQL